MAVAFVGAFIGMELLREYRKQRMSGYKIMQAQIEMRDKTVQYDPSITPAVVP